MPRSISSCLLCRTQSDSYDNVQLDPPQLSGTNGRTSERLSAATLASLRNTVLHSASTGDVRDVYRFGRTLGTGGYAVVKVAEHRETGQEVAVKIVRLPKDEVAAEARASATSERAPLWPRTGSGSRTGFGSRRGSNGSRRGSNGSSGSVSKGSMPGRVTIEEDVLKEVEILKSLDHPHILKMHEYFIDAANETAFLVTDYMRGGELLEALLERGSYSEEDARTIFRPILSGVAYLHDMHITHRDLKLENLLLRNAGDLSSVCICDFGLAKAALMSSAHEADPDANPWLMDLMCGTLAYVAPEVLSSRQYTAAIDLWSCGVILYILISGGVPFEGSSERHIVANILGARYTMAGPEFATVSKEAQALIRGLLCIDPRRRLRARQALAHPWLNPSPPSKTRSRDGKPLPAAPADASNSGPILVSTSRRLKAYAEQRPRPELRMFAPGEFLVRRGERATEVFLIRRGTCEVLVDPGEGAAAGSEPALVTLGTRGVGDIVGEQGVVVNDNGRWTLYWKKPAEAGGAEAAAPAAPATPPPPPQPLSEADARWNTPLLAHKFAKRWVGRRRTVSVRARDEVTAVVLQKSHVAWALDVNAGLQDRNDTVTEEVLRALARRGSEAAVAAEEAEAGAAVASREEAEAGAAVAEPPA